MVATNDKPKLARRDASPDAYKTRDVSQRENGSKEQKQSIGTHFLFPPGEEGGEVGSWGSKRQKGRKAEKTAKTHGLGGNVGSLTTTWPSDVGDAAPDSHGIGCSGEGREVVCASVEPVESGT